jgi:hypothetical protein
VFRFPKKPLNPQFPATRIFPDNDALKRYMNVLFETLRHYYENNFDCVATKLGTLILLTNEIEVRHALIKKL